MLHDYDAILIGSGPAGSCAAAILAEYGHRVLILEREKFPRYHIGESLVPFSRALRLPFSIRFSAAA